MRRVSPVADARSSVAMARAAVLALSLALSWTGGVSAQDSCVTGSSCEECVSNTTCIWCGSTQKCVEYSVKTFFPSHTLCALNYARWSNCWMNYQTLIIAGAVLVCVLIISLLICCICCFKKCSKTRSGHTDECVEREAELRRVRHEERKAEMRSRHDEIRRKYGLTKESPYTRFENN